MNGSKSPDPPASAVESGVQDETLAPVVNGHHSPDGSRVPPPNQIDDPPLVPSVENGDSDAAPESAASTRRKTHVTNNADDGGAESEAETLIDSPVKRKEAEKESTSIKVERSAKNRIGSLPVPTGDDDDDDDNDDDDDGDGDNEDGDGDAVADVDAPGSPVGSVNGANTIADRDVKDEDVDMDVGSDKDKSSTGSLSSVRSSSPDGVSRASSQSRAASERPQLARTGENSPNPRKRKHRASSVSLPNKRQSMDPPKRKVREMHLGGGAEALESLQSSKGRSHRRAASTQSALTDVAADGSNRKRRAISQFPVRDPKTTKGGWEESDASSEATSHGQSDPKRPRRGIGRSTSTPGRPTGREHKRHVNKYGFTKLAEACEAADLDLVKEWREKDPDQLELAEFAGNKPLQIAALNGNDEVVAYLIDQGCQIDCANVDKDTPLIDAAENGHVEVVRILLKAGVDPLRQNLKGQQALDVVTDETDDADAIRAALRHAIESWNSDGAKQRREEEEILRHQALPNKGLQFMARSYENLLKLVTINDRNGVKEFLDARVPVDNAIIAAAAKTGDVYLVNMLLAEMTEKKAYQKAEKPMLAVLGTSHFEMVKSITELDQFNPLYRSRAGKTWAELAEERNGPNSRQEVDLLQRLYNERSAHEARRSSSAVVPRDTGKRRTVHRQTDDESDDEHDDDEEEEEDEEAEEEEETTAPKRNAGRRLMSRKDMRREKAFSDSDSDESTSAIESASKDLEEKTDEESSNMKPPASPSQMRDTGAGRPRRSSVPSQPPDSSPRLRRRSSSLRGPQDPALPAVIEEAVENQVYEKEKKEEVVKKEPEEAATRALEQAQSLDIKRREEAEALAVAEKEAKAEAEAKRAEDAQRVEEERKVEELRVQQAQEAEAKRVQEDKLRMEEARKAEEERRQWERELEEARDKIRGNVLASLPPVLSHVLDPTSTFVFGGQESLDYVLTHFTPLLAVKQDPKHVSNAIDGHHEDSWILNVQAAPLLGRQGLELLLPDGGVEFERTVARHWDLHRDFSARDRAHVDEVVEALSADARRDSVYGDDDGETPDELSFDTELQRAADRYNAAVEAKRKLQDGVAALYCVKLADVLASLHPLFRDTPIQVRNLDSRASPSSEVVGKVLDVRRMDDFVSRLSAFWSGAPPPLRTCNATPAPTALEAARGPAGVTDVVVVQEK